FNFKDDVHGDIIALASTEKIIESMSENFASKVVPCLKPTQIEDMKESLRRLIDDDLSIAPRKKSELLLLITQDNLSLLLSEVYLYALNRPNKLTANMPTAGSSIHGKNVNDVLCNIELDNMENDLKNLHQAIGAAELSKYSSTLNLNDFVAPFPVIVTVYIDVANSVFTEIRFYDSEINDAVCDFLQKNYEFSEWIIKYSKPAGATHGVMVRIEKGGEIENESFADVQAEVYRRRKNLYDAIKTLFAIEERKKKQLEDFII
ncbi:MAG: hypothetical protein RSA92_05370, partial [Bacteroidaceae bacterium]